MHRRELSSFHRSLVSVRTLGMLVSVAGVMRLVKEGCGAVDPSTLDLMLTWEKSY